MKNRILFRTVLLTFIGVINFSAFSQMDVRDLEGFTASLSNDKVFLSWTMTKGNTCLGFKILRSTDEVNFMEIGSVPGYCGELTKPATYTFTDRGPVLNAVNTYKLILGSDGFSNTVSIEYFDIPEKGYVITPHPVTNVSIIHFKNDSGLLSTLTLYSSDGATVYSEKTHSDRFEIKIDQLLSGEYLFSISNEKSNELITGKLIIIQ